MDKPHHGHIFSFSSCHRPSHSPITQARPRVQGLSHRQGNHVEDDRGSVYIPTRRYLCAVLRGGAAIPLQHKGGEAPGTNDDF